MKIDRLVGAGVAAWLIARERLRPRPPTRTLAQRLDAFARVAPVAAAVTIHWDTHQIPFIEAGSLEDLGVAVGMVHAHLRLMQMEVLRRVAHGRVAEMAGPLAVELDQALRLMDFPRAVPAIIERMTPKARLWAEAFVRGVNHVAATGPMPPEFAFLGIRREPWTLADLIASGRVAAADVNWLVWGRLLRARAKMPAAAWAALWPALLAAGAPTPDQIFARHGSNACAVAGGRSASGAALFAADPHLSVALPNIWLACGMACPELHAAGLMPAGFPIIAIGRNRDIAWGGTSLHHAASDLFDVSDMTLTSRVETIRTRWAGTRRITLRESPLGPVVSDGMLFHDTRPRAMKWIGHRPSDEIGAMLGVMQAANSDQFAAALADFAIPGQNFLHATRDGHIGHLLACAAPHRVGPPADLVRPAAEAADWERIATTPDFPDRRDPAEGFVASANDAPPPSPVPTGFLFSPADRVQRLRTLLGGDRTIDLAAMAATQTDTRNRVGDARALAAACPEHPVAAMLRDWDGDYATGSHGALLFEAAIGHLQAALPDRSEVDTISVIWQSRAMLMPRMLALPMSVLGEALDAAAALLRQHGDWGGVHRMRLRHYFGSVPGLGDRYGFGEYPSPGGHDSLHKTGHGPVRGPHTVTYGSSARFLADLADPDANRVVLLGGQDGFLGSTTFLDQLPLWKAGEYVVLPLRLEAARLWPHHTELSPA